MYCYQRKGSITNLTINVYFGGLNIDDVSKNSQFFNFVKSSHLTPIWKGDLMLIHNMTLSSPHCDPNKSYKVRN